MLADGTVGEVLRDHDLEPDWVAELVASEGRFGQVVSGELDVDRMDYLVRDAHHTGVPYGTIDHGRLVRELTFVDGELVLDEGNVQTAESLLVARALMSPTVYSHSAARSSKAMLRRAAERLLDAPETDVDAAILQRMDDHDLIVALRSCDRTPTDLRNRINTLPSGEWIAQLPSPSFGEMGPAPFSVKPLPIAAGHPESDVPLSVEQVDHFETVALLRLSERTQTQYRLAEAPSESETADDEGWGSRPNAGRPTSAESANPADSTQSSFIGQASSGLAADEENEGNEEKEADTTGSLFGDTESTESEESVGEEEETAVDENESSPVQAGGVTVPDDELRRRGLTHDDVRFLTRILNVMNVDAPNHGLLDSMSAFKNDFDDLYVQRLVDQDLLEEGRVCGRKY